MSLQPLVGRRYREYATPHVFRLNRLRLAVAAGHSTFNRDSLAILIDRLERHTVLYAGYQMSTLWIERHQQLILLGLRNILFGTLVHTANIIVARLFTLAVNGEHPGIKPIPRAEIVGCHLLIIKIPRIRTAIPLVAYIEVKHPTSISAQFVIAGIEGVGQCKLSAGVARSTDDNVLPLH